MAERDRLVTARSGWRNAQTPGRAGSGAKTRGTLVASMPNNQNLRRGGRANGTAMSRNSVCSRSRRWAACVIVKHSPIAAYTLL